MSEPTLFDVAPYREATAGEVTAGDWIKGLGWPWSWLYVTRAAQYPSGKVSITTSKTAGGSTVGGYLGDPADRVLIYNGTPPAEERAS